MLAASAGVEDKALIPISCIDVCCEWMGNPKKDITCTYSRLASIAIEERKVLGSTLGDGSRTTNTNN